MFFFIFPFSSICPVSVKYVRPSFLGNFLYLFLIVSIRLIFVPFFLTPHCSMYCQHSYVERHLFRFKSLRHLWMNCAADTTTWEIRYYTAVHNSFLCLYWYFICFSILFKRWMPPSDSYHISRRVLCTTHVNYCTYFILISPICISPIGLSLLLTNMHSLLQIIVFFFLITFTFYLVVFSNQFYICKLFLFFKKVTRMQFLL